MSCLFINLFRAIAAFWVLFAHCMIWGGWYGIPLPSAKIAVDLFMMISGYLMAVSASARDETEPLNQFSNWLRFWVRRYFRIAPAYYLSLGLAIIIGDQFLGGYKLLQSLHPDFWGSGGIYDPARIEYTPLNVLAHLSFIFGLHPNYAFSTFLPDWSLSLEMQFYFVFPALFLVMRKYGFLKTALIISIISISIGYYISSHTQYYEPSLLVFKLQYFIAGILTFRIVLTKNSWDKVTMTTCALLLVSLEFKYGKELMVLPAILVSMVFFGCIENASKTPEILTRLVNSNFIKFASDTSYGVYLFHGFFISLCGYILTSNIYLLSLNSEAKVGVMFVFVSTLSYLSGYVIREWVELPGINIGRLISNNLILKKVRS